MGKQSARMWFQGDDHKDIYYEGHYHDKMYLGSKLIWEKLPGLHPTFCLYFTMPMPVVSYYSGYIDEYGYFLTFNPGAVVEKCAVTLGSAPSAIQGIGPGTGNLLRFNFACRGTGITSVTLAPYLSYKGNIVSSGRSNGQSYLVDLVEDTNGVWQMPRWEEGALLYYCATEVRYDGRYLTMNAAANTEHMRLFAGYGTYAQMLTDMQAWLLEE